MKNFLVGAAIAGALVSPSYAADLPVKARPSPMVAAPVATWTGFYAGVNAGGIFGASTDTVEPTGCFTNTAILCGGPLSNNPLRTDTGNLNGSGFTAGGQAGYNWQTGAWVYGVETDFNYSSLNPTDSVSRALAAPLVGTLTHSVNEKLDWFGTLRGRFGYTPAPQWLLYATGGLAYGHINSSSSVMFSAGTDTYVGSISKVRVGWTAGGGAEYAFSPNWSFKAEYLYMDLGSFNYANTCTSPAVICTGFAQAPSYQTDLKVREHIVRVGLNYRWH